ncbi:MAG: hypothetical protein H7X88_06590 [Gloeobacteraceae cyanobacterium ES-bin-316]|nr:hypothetical protein [Ferruginibacter sp.]
MDYFINLKRLATKERLPGGASAFLQMQHSTLAYTVMKAGTKIQGHNHEDDAVDIVLEGELEM